jgi:hypothetical protein
LDLVFSLSLGHFYLELFGFSLFILSDLRLLDGKFSKRDVSTSLDLLFVLLQLQMLGLFSFHRQFEGSLRVLALIEVFSSLERMTIKVILTAAAFSRPVESKP